LSLSSAVCCRAILWRGVELAVFGAPTHTNRRYLSPGAQLRMCSRCLCWQWWLSPHTTGCVLCLCMCYRVYVFMAATCSQCRPALVSLLSFTRAFGLSV